MTLDGLTTERAIWLRTEGNYIYVLIEINGQWVEVIRERREGEISHIVEQPGIKTEPKDFR